ncbi:hypothetical protein ACFZDJ_04505 [Streptomyces sp. NPDC007896]|uniref:hypothetical protein n=1 Tax=Streptomyces sp. NPDC007896 TaxID=3364784 RepID=UPI0036E4826F
MTALQNAQNNSDPPRSPRDRMRDVLIGVLVSIIVGLRAGIIHRLAAEKVTFRDAVETGCTAGGWTAVFAVAVLVYVWHGR